MYHNIPNHPITAANNRTFNAIGKGDIAVDVPHGLMSRRIVLKVQLTIISISCLIESRYEAQFKEGRCIIMRRGDIIGLVPISKNGLFKTRHAYTLTAHNSSELIDLPTLHWRLGHLVPKSICTLMNAHLVMGLRLIDDLSPFSCNSCDWAKMTHKRIRKHGVTPQATHFGAEVHSDVWGPSVIKSINNCSYYVSFTDDYLHYSLVAFLHTKDETLKAYKSYAAWARTQHSVPIQHLRSDRGGEYLSFEFANFLQEQGTEHCLTTANTPEHNGVAEALNHQLLKHACAMMHQANLPRKLWAEAIRYAAWLKNRLPTKVLGHVTPYERLYGTKPHLAGLPKWGQWVWVHNSSGSKLDTWATQACWVGNDGESTHAHWIYWQNTNTISVEHDIKFINVFKDINIQPDTEQETPASLQQTPQEPVPSQTPRATMQPTSQPSQLHQSQRVPKPSQLMQQIAQGEFTTSNYAEADCIADDEHGDFIATLIEEVENNPKSLSKAQARNNWPR